MSGLTANELKNFKNALMGVAGKANIDRFVIDQTTKNHPDLFTIFQEYYEIFSKYEQQFDTPIRTYFKRPFVLKTKKRDYENLKIIERLLLSLNNKEDFGGLLKLLVKNTNPDINEDTLNSIGKKGVGKLESLKKYNTQAFKVFSSDDGETTEEDASAYDITDTDTDDDKKKETKTEREQQFEVKADSSSSSEPEEKEDKRSPITTPRPKISQTNPKKPTKAEPKRVSGRKPKGAIFRKNPKIVRKIDVDTPPQKTQTQTQPTEQLLQPPTTAKKGYLRRRRKDKEAEERKKMSSAEAESIQAEIDKEAEEREEAQERRQMSKAEAESGRAEIARLSDMQEMEKTAEKRREAKERRNMEGAEIESLFAEADAGLGTPPDTPLQTPTNTPPDTPLQTPSNTPPSSPRTLNTPADTPPPTPPNTPIKMRVSKQNVKDIPTDRLPTAIDLIPEIRLSADDKTVQQLKDDIDYFYINFPVKLRKITRTKSNNLEVLKRFHKRVVAKLRGDKAERDAEDKKKMGVVIKGSEYIKDALKQIILENSIDGLSAADLLVNIEGEAEDLNDTAGSYEFLTNKANGKEYANKAPISRYIPDTDPELVKKQRPTFKPRLSRIPEIKAVYNII